MNALGFIAAIIQALAWPVAIVVVAILFRRQIKALLARDMSHVKAGPIEIDWVLEQVKVETVVGTTPQRALSDVEKAKAILRGYPSSIYNELHGLARQNPAQAVFQAYDRILMRLRELVRDKSVSPQPVAGTSIELARLASDRGLIAPMTATAIEGVTHLRNLAAHGGSVVTQERALDYLSTADMILFLLNQKPD